MVNLILESGIDRTKSSPWSENNLMTLFPDISDLFITLEEDKVDKRKKQKRQSDRKAYWKKAIANGYKPVRYRKGDEKLSKQ